MCGIAGILTPDPSVDLDGALPRMMASLAHRGPDQNGMTVRRRNGYRVGLAHTRLSILDLSEAGRQPMTASGGRAWLTYNGEVYNFAALKTELGHADFRSRTDSEVILRGYERWNADSFPRLRGMFAFGLWDEEARRLLLVRDPLGIKPLYYHLSGKTLVFASEIRALLASGLVPRRLSGEGLRSYLAGGSIASPWTILDGVWSLPPGHVLTARPRPDGLDIEEKRYAADLEPGEPAAAVDRRQAARELFEVLKESVRLHLVSDVPLGLFLSGGIDSSVLVALMSQATKEPAKTYSVVFTEPEFTEGHHARLIASRFGTDHHEVPLSEQDLLGLLPRALQAMDQPTADGVNTYVISKAVREAGITVALSGLGGDELFGGYGSFQRARRIAPLAMIPRPVRTAGAALGKKLFNGSVKRDKWWDFFASDGTPRAAYSISRRLFSRDEIRRLAVGDLDVAVEEPCNGPVSRDSINVVSQCELQGYMANTLLRDSDFMSMAHALEIRVPFVDCEVVHHVLGLPGDWKLQPGRPKPLLLDALGDLLPEEIWRRPKMGFTLPFERWMHSSLKADLQDVFQAAGPLRDAGLRPEAARRIWLRLEQQPAKEKWSRAWALFVLRSWCDLNGVRA